MRRCVFFLAQTKGRMFPFLFLSLSLSLRPFVCAESKISTKLAGDVACLWSMALGRASAAFAGVPGIPGLGVCDFFRFCQSFTSNFPFPFFFPIIILLSLFLGSERNREFVIFTSIGTCEDIKRFALVLAAVHKCRSWKIKRTLKSDHPMTAVYRPSSPKVLSISSSTGHQLKTN